MAGCATRYVPEPVPSAVLVPPETDLALTEVAPNVPEHQGAAVRWGGTVVGLLEGGDAQAYRVLARPVDEHGRPDTSRPALGEFVFTPQTQAREGAIIGHDVTVAGIVTGSVAVSGDDVPLVSADALHVWYSRRTYASYPASNYPPSYGYSNSHLYDRYRYGYRYRPYRGPAYQHHYYRYHNPFPYGRRPYGNRYRGHYPGPGFSFGFSYGN